MIRRSRAVVDTPVAAQAFLRSRSSEDNPVKEAESLSRSPV